MNDDEPPPPHPHPPPRWALYLMAAWGFSVTALGCGILVGIIAVVAVKVFRWLA